MLCQFSVEVNLLSVFVLPEFQGEGIGRRIVKVLESDAYFPRAWRTEVGSSITAVGFYRKLGYGYKNGITTPDEDHVIRLEKKKQQSWQCGLGRGSFFRAFSLFLFRIM